jgi:hypothetical protein
VNMRPISDLIANLVIVLSFSHNRRKRSAAESTDKRASGVWRYLTVYTKVRCGKKERNIYNKKIKRHEQATNLIRKAIIDVRKPKDFNAATNDKPCCNCRHIWPFWPAVCIEYLKDYQSICVNLYKISNRRALKLQSIFAINIFLSSN